MKGENMKLYHGSELVGEITTNRGMSAEEACELLNIDINETDSAGDPIWDLEAFRMEY